MLEHNTPFALVADVGGTNARFAIVSQGDTTPRDTINLSVDAFANIDLAIKHYIKQLGIDLPSRVCIAIACPTHMDRISMTNNGWIFSKSQLQSDLGLAELKVINDYAAMALAAPFLNQKEKMQVGGGEPIDGFPIAVLGPGTGLGVSGLVRADSQNIPVVTEGGHVDFAPTTEQEIEILRFLLQRYEHVSAERLLSGMGLENIYLALARIRGVPVEKLKPAQISEAAFQHQDPLARDTLDQFCAILGSVAGNCALTYGAQGGVYITGGIIPRMPEFFAQSSFRERFEAKGRFVNYMQSIPTYLMLASQPGLIGAAAAALER